MPLDAVREHEAATQRTDEASAKSASLLAALVWQIQHAGAGWLS